MNRINKFKNTGVEKIQESKKCIECKKILLPTHVNSKSKTEQKTYREYLCSNGYSGRFEQIFEKEMFEKEIYNTKLCENLVCLNCNWCGYCDEDCRITNLYEIQSKIKFWREKLLEKMDTWNKILEKE